jgi:hypothetical protein
MLLLEMLKGTDLPMKPPYLTLQWQNQINPLKYCGLFIHSIPVSPVRYTYTILKENTLIKLASSRR